MTTSPFLEDNHGGLFLLFSSSHLLLLQKQSGVHILREFCSTKAGTRASTMRENCRLHCSVVDCPDSFHSAHSGTSSPISDSLLPMPTAKAVSIVASAMFPVTIDYGIDSFRIRDHFSAVYYDAQVHLCFSLSLSLFVLDFF